MSHALIRTSPKGKGQKFVGICIKCGEPDLPFEAAHEPCPHDTIVSDAAALTQILEPQ